MGSQLSHYRRKYTENDPNYPRQLGVSQQVSERVVDGDIISPSSLQMNNKKSQNNVIMSEFLTKLNVKAIKVNQSLLPTFSKLNKRNDTSTLERLNNDNFDDGKQDAKSLIGMFEQNRSETSSAIFPQSEHWQYVGKEKS